MRLGQIARKLALRPSEIVEFLSKHNLPVEDNANTRLEDAQVALITQHFAPAELAPQLPVAPVVYPQPPPAQPVLETELDSPAEDSGDEKTNQVPLPDVEDPSTQETGSTDVIKASKIELSGLKVLGKIDLPEPKKKETLSEAQEGSVPAPEGEKRSTPVIKRNQEDRRPRRDQRSSKNPIAAQREREAREEEEKRKEALEREKERKTQNYLRKVKMSPPTKAMRIVNEEVEEMSAKELEEEPKSWFGKFIKWLST